MKIPLVRFNRRLSPTDKVYNFFATISGLGIFTWEILKQMWIPPYDISEIKKHMNELGVKTFPIVSILGIIIGLVLAMQSYPIFQKFS